MPGAETRESWYGVQDPKERKKIQDRLAQRARRRRLAGASRNGRREMTVHGGRGTRLAVEHETSPGFDAQTIMPGLTNDPCAISIISNDTARSRTRPLTSSNSSVVQHGSPISRDHQLLISPDKAVWVAFDENGQRMGIKSLCVGLVRSRRQPPDVPETLQPTPLQLTTPHPIWLDRLPFPRLRDNMILLMQMVNVEEFYVDVFLSQSFHVDRSKAAHDPNAYRINSAFRAKWGYLFL